MPVPKTTARKLADWVDDYGIDTVLFVLPLLLGASGILISDEAIRVVQSWLGFSDAIRDRIQACLFVLIFIIIILHIIVFLAYFKHKSTLSQLSSRIEALEADNAAWAQDVKTLAQGYLYSFATEALQFGTREHNTERITLYVHDDDGHFLPVGRYSSNAAYAKLGRSRYPDDQGCIGLAWNHKDFFRNDYPDPTSNLEGYKYACAADNLPADVAERLRMKSRLLYGHRIDDAEGESLAVIIIESTETGRFTEDQLKGQFGESGERYIRRLAEKIKAKLPHISEARRVGL